MSDSLSANRTPDAPAIVCFLLDVLSAWSVAESHRRGSWASPSSARQGAQTGDRRGSRGTGSRRERVVSARVATLASAFMG